MPFTIMPFYNYQERPEELETPLHNLGYLLKVLNENSIAQVEESMKEFDLTAVQWHPLVIIDLKQADTPAEVARIVNTDTGAMTRMLDRLEKKGFIKRERSETDRRVVKLKLTDKGNQVTKKLMPTVATVLNKALQGFTREEYELFKSLTMRMLNNLNPDEVKRLEDNTHICYPSRKSK